jgi:coproporphyrinogen III oxidase-like Fe-S oxidoreductase
MNLLLLQHLYYIAAKTPGTLSCRLMTGCSCGQSHLTNATPRCLHNISAASAKPIVGLGFIAVSCCKTVLTCQPLAVKQKAEAQHEGKNVDGPATAAAEQQQQQQDLVHHDHLPLMCFKKCKI